MQYNMKKILTIFTILLLTGSFQRCNQDDVTTHVEKIQIAISISPSDGTSDRVKVALPPDASVLLTLESSAGEPILTQHPLKVFVSGESYITEPVELFPGSYKITDFLVIDPLSEVLFAAPKNGSPLAEVVANPLPRSSNVSENNVFSFNVQVLEVSRHKPEDFGYFSFNVKAGSSFRIAVFANEDGKSKLTDAHAYIVNGTDTLDHHELKAKVNNVFFTGDPRADYSLIVVKPGYDTYTLPFKFSDLEHAPLKVYLHESVPQTNVFRLWYSPTAIPEEPPVSRFSMIIGADEAADITVDFGNGAVQDYFIPAGSKIEVLLEMATGSSYIIQVSGEIDKITSFEPYWDSDMNKIDFTNLINLQEIFNGPYGSIEIPTVDLTNNHKLEVASIGGSRVDTLLLPTDHFLRDFAISGSPHLSGAEIDDLIDNIYSNTVDRNITNGTFYNISLTGEMQGPLSEESLAKLRTLRDVYGWVIFPDPA
jgi:hypothetical protein